MSKVIDWVTKPINLRNIVIIILFLASSVVAVLAVYGGVRICTLQERFDIVKAQQVKITELRKEICWLREVYEHVVIKLSAESKYSIITSKNGQRIHLFATKLGIEPITPNKPYSRHRVAFLHDEKIDLLAEQLDSNNDYVINLDESFKLY